MHLPGGWYTLEHCGEETSSALAYCNNGGVPSFGWEQHSLRHVVAVVPLGPTDKPCKLVPGCRQWPPTLAVAEPTVRSTAELSPIPDVPPERVSSEQAAMPELHVLRCPRRVFASPVTPHSKHLYIF